MQVKLEKFEGPLGLLLQLIEEEELDITEISLAKIADQYIEHIKALSVTHPDELADFLVVAAKLLLIKSKALLPYLYIEEEEDIKELEEQLKMYKEFLEASKHIEELIGKKNFMFAREFSRQSIFSTTKLFSPPKGLTKDDLRMALSSLIVKLRPPEKLEEERIERKIHLEEKIFSIQQLLVNKIRINFSYILEKAGSKTEVIVSFLAMLELIKQKEILVSQHGLFEEIEINKV